MSLKLDPHMHHPGHVPGADLAAGDDFYEALLDAHQGLSDAESAALNARLILVLANHIGDVSVLLEALEAARQG
jgi:anthranilate phosphoribosyltransferase